MSVVLVGPDGQTWARQRTLVLSSREVAWFLDGPSLFRNLTHLGTLAARLVCKRCVKEPRVYIRMDRAYFHCCRHGHVDLTKPSEVAPLLRTLEWTFQCPRCEEPLVGDNDPQGLVFDVRCPCTKRVYHRPAQGLVS